MNILTRRLLALGAAGTIALGVAGAAVAQNGEQGAQAQKPQARMRRHGGHRGQMGGMRGLNLTTEQQAKVKALRQQFHQDFLAILTPEQRAQMQEARQNRGAHRGMRGQRGERRTGMRMRGMRQMAEKLNLTEDQKARMQNARRALRQGMQEAAKLDGEKRAGLRKDVREKFRLEMQSILTPEQQEQMKTLRPQRRNRTVTPEAAGS